LGEGREELKKRAVDIVRRQAEEAFDKGYKWLYEQVSAGELDYDDLCTIDRCDDPADIAFFFVGDYRDVILRLRKASSEFFGGVKRAVSEILNAVREGLERPKEGAIFD